VLARLSRRHLSITPDAYLQFPESEILVNSIARRMRADVRSYTESLRGPLKLVGVLADNEKSRLEAKTYSMQIRDIFNEDEIDYEQVLSSADVDELEVTIKTLNHDPEVDGILVFYPIFGSKRQDVHGLYLNRNTGVRYKTYDDYLRDVVCPSKDVEALSQNYNARWLFRARGKNRNSTDFYAPCTALAVMEILKEALLRDWTQTTVAIINRSELMGRPLAALLALKGATVYSVDEHTVLRFSPGGRLRKCSGLVLETVLSQSHVVVTGVPSPHFQVSAEMLPPDALVINVSEHKNVCEQSLLKRHDVTMIPRIGKVTIAALQQNLIRLHAQRTLIDAAIYASG